MNSNYKIKKFLILVLYKEFINVKEQYKTSMILDLISKFKVSYYLIKIYIYVKNKKTKKKIYKKKKWNLTKKSN